VLIYGESRMEAHRGGDPQQRAIREAALRGLKAAQANLIQAEKMASLGQLTARHRHEIKTAELRNNSPHCRRVLKE